ncbi:hypothetical protein BH09BAC2_BH09BAC2_22280 [soil metagenome]
MKPNPHTTTARLHLSMLTTIFTLFLFSVVTISCKKDISSEKLLSGSNLGLPPQLIDSSLKSIIFLWSGPIDSSVMYGFTYDSNRNLLRVDISKKYGFSKDSSSIRITRNSKGMITSTVKNNVTGIKFISDSLNHYKYALRGNRDTIVYVYSGNRITEVRSMESDSLEHKWIYVYDSANFNNVTSIKSYVAQNFYWKFAGSVSYGYDTKVNPLKLSNERILIFGAPAGLENEMFGSINNVTARTNTDQNYKSTYSYYKYNINSQNKPISAIVSPIGGGRASSIYYNY